MVYVAAHVSDVPSQDAVLEADRLTPAIVTSMAEWEISGIDFEIATTGGGQGDPAIDLLGGEGTQPGWGQGSQSTDWSYYEFSTVPAPGVLALFAVAGITRRRRH